MQERSGQLLLPGFVRCGFYRTETVSRVDLGLRHSADSAVACDRFRDKLAKPRLNRDRHWAPVGCGSSCNIERNRPNEAGLPS